MEEDKKPKELPRSKILDKIYEERAIANREIQVTISYDKITEKSKVDITGKNVAMMDEREKNMIFSLSRLITNILKKY